MGLLLALHHAVAFLTLPGIVADSGLARSNQTTTTPLTTSAAILPPCEYKKINGFCKPFDHRGTSNLCSQNSQVKPVLAATCGGRYAPDEGGKHDDNSRQGKAYFDPDSCDEECARKRCDAEVSCKGYVISWQLYFPWSAVALRSAMNGTGPNRDFQCVQKVTEGPCSSVGSTVSLAAASKLCDVFAAVMCFSAAFIQHTAIS
eukprot:TRINITY_DN64210_c0_g1_i1.p1 TRINITY_DN64210_c0_g1~~TRINITY_DN64210_c0_g1_i1.p1  ORF type:complete len:203 (+),score=36.11 TRINITY_DN64210_c0_g1_i1:34-642(+)